MADPALGRRILWVRKYLEFVETAQVVFMVKSSVGSIRNSVVTIVTTHFIENQSRLRNAFGATLR